MISCYSRVILEFVFRRSLHWIKSSAVFLGASLSLISRLTLNSRMISTSARKSRSVRKSCNLLSKWGAPISSSHIRSRGSISRQYTPSFSGSSALYSTRGSSGRIRTSGSPNSLARIPFKRYKSRISRNEKESVK